MAWTSGRLSIVVTRGCIEALTPWRNPDLFSLFSPDLYRTGNGSVARGGNYGRIDSRLGSSVRGNASFGTVVRASEPVAHKSLGAESSLLSSKGVSDGTTTAACTDSHRKYVCGFVYKSPGRHSLQGSVQAGNESPAMGGLLPPLHQSSAHPFGHAFEEGDSSRRVEIAPNDLEQLRESGGGSVHHERECALPAVPLPVSLPAGRGRADIAESFSCRPL